MDALEYAIQMEHDGEKYYRDQAQINESNSLHAVCNMLAEDERQHALLLIKKQKEEPYTLSEMDGLSKRKNIFEGAEDLKVVGKDRPSQLDFYRIASEKETQSIALYTDLLAGATKDGDRELFRYLIKQEKQHYELLDELASLLRNAEEWVESAEFGIRKEY